MVCPRAHPATVNKKRRSVACAFGRLFNGGRGQAIGIGEYRERRNGDSPEPPERLFQLDRQLGLTDSRQVRMAPAVRPESYTIELAKGAELGLVGTAITLW